MKTNPPADIILSLTRTTRVGYLRDIRRLTVALSRARLGLYILGRRSVFESCYELRDAFDLLLQNQQGGGRPDKLALVTGEMWPSQRVLADEAGKAGVEGEALMEGVEHIGQFVFEMTSTRVRQLREERGLVGEVPVVEEVEGAYGGLGVGEEEGEEDGEGEGEEVVRGEGFEAEEDD
jgi:intron-binding protein aquarius